MATTEPIPFSELRALLLQLGYAEKRIPGALVFRHPREGLIVFRVYRDDEALGAGDLVSTRTFLDMRGQMDAADFDARLRRASTPA
jgi:hypothetical protein